MNRYIQYMILVGITFALFACSGMQSSTVLDFKKNNYYFAAGFEDEGLYFYAKEPILSIKELAERKNNFIKNNPDYDRYYYKVERKKSHIRIDAYSLLTNKLMKTWISDTQHRLRSSRQVKDENKTIECKREYIKKYQKMTAQERCTNGTYFIHTYVLDTRYKVYTHIKTHYYKNKKLQHKYIYKEDGTLFIFNAKGRLEKKDTWIAQSDFTPIFKK